jgi:hypothetical protein
MATRPGYPLSIHDQRALPPDFTGDVFVWDIDKTYLSTRFSSMQGMARIPFEFAVDKRAIPGMPEVLRGLRRGAGQEPTCAPLYFVTASPPFLRKVVEKKMLLDGVEFDGIIFKDWVGTLLALKPGRLREQVGFKLAALFTGRATRPMSREFLFGDDVELDADSFSLYARHLAGELDSAGLETEMQAHGVPRDDRQSIHALAGALPAARGGVGRIYIHLERQSDPARFGPLGARVAPVRGAYQLALALLEEGLVRPDTVRAARAAVARLRRGRDGTLEELSRDAVERGLIARERLDGLDA